MPFFEILHVKWRNIPCPFVLMEVWVLLGNQSKNQKAFV